MSIRIDYAPMNNAPTTAESAGGRMSKYVSKTSSTPCGIIDGYPLVESEPVYEQLRRGLIPVSRPTDELVRYTRTLESIIKGYTDAIDFKLLHESAVPHWVDSLEG